MDYKTFEFSLLKNDQEIHKEIYRNQSENEKTIQFDCLGYQTTLDLETETFTRSNDEYEFFLAFQKKCCTIHLKREKLDFDIQVDECELTIANNKIILEYSIETEDAKNKLLFIRKDETHE